MAIPEEAAEVRRRSVRSPATSEGVAGASQDVEMRVSAGKVQPEACREVVPYHADLAWVVEGEACHVDLPSAAEVGRGSVPSPWATCA